MVSSGVSGSTGVSSFRFIKSAVVVCVASRAVSQYSAWLLIAGKDLLAKASGPNPSGAFFVALTCGTKFLGNDGVDEIFGDAARKIGGIFQQSWDQVGLDEVPFGRLAIVRE